MLKTAADIVGVKLFEIEWKTLGTIGVFENGKGMPKSLLSKEGSIGAIHYGHIYTKYNLFVDVPVVRIATQNTVGLKRVNTGDLVIAKTSENIKDVMKTIAYLGSESVVVGGHASIFRHNENAKYLSYVFNGANYFFRQKCKLVKGVKVIELSSTDMKKIRIPMPPLSIQEHIVDILDIFYELVKNFSEELPKEIDLRRKQYEYYRDKLIDFDRAD